MDDATKVPKNQIAVAMLSLLVAHLGRKILYFSTWGSRIYGESQSVRTARPSSRPGRFGVSSSR